MDDRFLCKRWCLRDFGSLQFLWDAFSGEYIKVYGVGAVLADGPWKLDVSSGRAELVQINGDKPEDLIRLDPEELASVKVFPSENGQIMVVDKREGTSPKLWQAWLDSSAGKGESKAVTCTVQGFEAFECVCFWPAVPQLCGDKPVCVWVDFKWLLTYVYGKAAAGRAWKYAKMLKDYLGKLGLDESHVEDSAASQAMKRRRLEEGASPKAANDESLDEWRVSILAAILFWRTQHSPSFGQGRMHIRVPIPTREQPLC